MSSSELFDVLVVGGGPSGSCAAAYAQRSGLRTLVVERLPFPRFRIGESLLPMCNELLREAGVWSKVESAGFMPKYGAVFLTGDGGASKEVDFSCGLVPGLDRTFQVERSRFDHILLDHARSLGAEVWMGATVRAIEVGDSGANCLVSVETSTGTRRIVARWVLDAGGRDNFFPSSQKNEMDRPRFPRRVAIYSHFRGVRRPEGRAAGSTIVVRLSEGWFWMIPLDAECTSVGLVTAVTAIRGTGSSPEKTFWREIEKSSKLRELMEGAEVCKSFQVTADYSYFRKELARGRFLLIGDAAGFFDPIFSSGVYMGLWSARQAVSLIVRADAEKRPLFASECGFYTKAIKRHARVFRRLIEVFYDPNGFAVFMCRRVPWKLAPGLTSIVAGHVRLTWPLKWRFYTFLAICRLQRLFRIVDPVSVKAEAGSASSSRRSESEPRALSYLFGSLRRGR